MHNSPSESEIRFRLNLHSIDELESFIHVFHDLDIKLFSLLARERRKSSGDPYHDRAFRFGSLLVSIASKNRFVHLNTSCIRDSQPSVLSSSPLEFELELGDDNVFVIEGFTIDNQGITEIRVLVINYNVERSSSFGLTYWSAKHAEADPAKGPACPQLRMLSAGDFEFNSPVPGSPLWGIV